MENDIRALPVLIGQLFQTVQALNKIYPGRPFTPDGHLVGSIGEVVAADTYGLILEKVGTKGFDARTDDGKTVEIKLTGGESVDISSDPTTPDLLIVLKLVPKTGFEEFYNGQFPLELWRGKKANKAGFKSLRLAELRKLNPKLLKERNPLEKLNSLFRADPS